MGPLHSTPEPESDGPCSLGDVFGVNPGEEIVDGTSPRGSLVTRLNLSVFHRGRARRLARILERSPPILALSQSGKNAPALVDTSALLPELPPCLFAQRQLQTLGMCI